MTSSFPGFPQEGIDFFRRLARNNRREWFQPRKAAFEEYVKGPMRLLVEAVNEALASFAPAYVTDPGRAVYRFYRDTRFSPDKSPYKDRIAANFPRRGITRHDGAGYYFSVSDKEVAAGGGVYSPTPETLMAIRRRIAECPAEFRRIISARPLRTLYGEMQGCQLTRVPKGFPAEHPAADLLRFKQFLFYIELPADIATTPAVYEAIVKRFRALAPFNDFLNQAVVSQRKKTDPLLAKPRP